MNNPWQYLQLAGLIVWLAGAIFFLFELGVFSSQPLKTAPTRECTLSLPVAGAIIVLYLMIQMACITAAVGLGVPQSAFEPETPATAQATTPTAPATATQPALTAADRIVVVNAVSMASAILTAIPVLVLLPRLFRNRSTGWGLHPRQFPKGALKGLLGLLIIMPILIAFASGLAYCYSLFQHEMLPHSTFQALDQHIPLLRQVLLCAMAIVVAPITEELFFRGILQTTLIQFRWGFFISQFVPASARPVGYRPSALQRWSAIFLASAAFAYLHQADQAPIIFVLSLALGYIYERTGNLWAPIALHMAFNSTEILNYFSGA